MPPLIRSVSAPALISAVTVSASSSLAAAASGVRFRSPLYGGHGALSPEGMHVGDERGSRPDPDRRRHAGHWHAPGPSGSPSSRTAASMVSSGFTLPGARVPAFVAAPVSFFFFFLPRVCSSSSSSSSSIIRASFPSCSGPARHSSSALTRSDCLVITASPSGVIPPTPTRGSAPSSRSILAMVGLDRSVAVSSGGIHEVGASTSAPSAMSLAAAAAWSLMTASTSGVTLVSWPSRRSEVRPRASMLAPLEKRYEIMPGLPHRAARKRGVASSSERRVSTCAPRSMSMRAMATLPLSAAACSGVVFLACADTKSFLLVSKNRSAVSTLGSRPPGTCPRSVATQSSSPTLHAPTTTAAVTFAPLPARCFTARSGPAASRSASIAAASSLNARSSSSSSSSSVDASLRRRRCRRW
mmetsp:Transcript_4006/g.17752  ORF Transcript_4006/g.17752 Transcript_4006/m.17752 type:complete len:413 (-) Transcript_4006:722-1960(-)